MTDRALRRLPVLDGGRPVGIVCLDNLAIEGDPTSALGHQQRHSEQMSSSVPPDPFPAEPPIPEPPPEPDPQPPPQPEPEPV